MITFFPEEHGRVVVGDYGLIELVFNRILITQASEALNGWLCFAMVGAGIVVVSCINNHSFRITKPRIAWISVWSYGCM